MKFLTFHPPGGELVPTMGTVVPIVGTTVPTDKFKICRCRLWWVPVGTKIQVGTNGYWWAFRVLLSNHGYWVGTGWVLGGC